jgi:small subunit ribosomal protein S27
LRNPYYDEHFDLSEPHQILGKTLALLGQSLREEKELPGTLSKSVEFLGWALYGRWEKVESVLRECINSKIPLAEETVRNLSQNSKSWQAAD